MKVRSFGQKRVPNLIISNGNVNAESEKQNREICERLGKFESSIFTVKSPRQISTRQMIKNLEVV